MWSLLHPQLVRLQTFKKYVDFVYETETKQREKGQGKTEVTRNILLAPNSNHRSSLQCHNNNIGKLFVKVGLLHLVLHKEGT